MIDALGSMVMGKVIINPRERLLKLVRVHQLLCTVRGIHPCSDDALEIVDKMLDEFNGSEDEDVIRRRFVN